MVLFFCSMSSNILLVGDSRVKDVTSNHFVTRSLPGARMSEISNYISINQSRIEAKYTMVVVSAGINDLSDRLANGDVIYRRNIFLQIQAIINKIKDSLCIPVVFTTIVSKDLKKCTAKFPRKSFFHPTAITLHMQHQFEAVVDAVNGEIDEANKSHNLHCAFHLDLRLASRGRRQRKEKILYDRLAADGLHPTSDLSLRWTRRVERLLAL